METGSQIALAFVAGFIAVLTLHQGAWAVLHAANLVPASKPAWSFAPVPPFDVPAVLSLAFWGGIWGIVLAFLLPDLEGPAYWAQWIVTGAIVLTLVALFIVAPLKGQAMMPFPWPRFWVGVVVNAAWGLATAALLRAFDMQSHRSTFH